MKPIPLSAPNGTLYAYACGVCHNVRAGWTHFAQTEGPMENGVHSSFLQAEQCCACRRCRAQLDETYGICATCKPIEDAEHAEWQVVWDAKNKAMHAAVTQSLTKAANPEAARLLAGAMSDLSEAEWCAGWLYGLEYILWGWLMNPEEGHAGVRPALDEIQRLSEQAGGWWVWNEEHGEGHGGALFVPFSEWVLLVKKHHEESTT